MSTENKMEKVLMESLTLIGLATGIGCVARNLNQLFIGDPSSNVEDFSKWALVLAGSSAAAACAAVASSRRNGLTNLRIWLEERK